MPLDAQYSFILVAAIVSATYFGLLALWAAARHDRGRRSEVSPHWLWHVAPLVLSLAALVRIPRRFQRSCCRAQTGPTTSP
jgi:cell division protein FtsW (lipid II flippase)